jgi:hypothetical protein
VSLLERLQETAQQDWKPLNTTGVMAFAAVFALIAWFSHSGQRWVPLLDSANLVFHEAGHPLFGLFWERLAVYGGTLAQLSFPIVVAASFWHRREAVSFAFALGWLAQNFWNVSRYMADARSQELPLVGGGEHDWTEIFLRWGALGADTTIAGVTRLLGWVLLLATCVWLARRWSAEN